MDVLETHQADRHVTESGLEICRAEGLSALTFRSLAERAGVSVASLQSRFGTKEKILGLVFSSAVEGEIRRLDRIAQMLDPAPMSRRTVLSLYRTMIQDSSSQDSVNRMMLLEMLVASIRDPGVRPYVGKWLRRLQRFWSDASRFHPHHSDLGWFLTELQIALWLTTICCHRPMESALANEDLIEYAFGDGKGSAPVWYAALLASAVELEPTLPLDRSLRSETLDRLLLAGAEVVAARGASALSYRTVAASAGVSLSAVTHHFPKRPSLIYAVYRRIYEEISFDSSGAPVGAELQERNALIGHYVGLMGRKFAGVSQPIAHAELYLLAARHPSLADLAWHMRMTRGAYWLGKAHPASNPLSSDAFDAHFRAIWMLGSALVHMTTEPEETLESTLRHSVSFGIGLLDPSSAKGETRASRKR